MTDAWDLGTLKRLAEQATPGPWRVSENEIQQVHGDTHVVCFGHDYDDYGYAKENDLVLIAALSPDVVLRLIARIEELTEELRDAEDDDGAF